MKYNTRTSNGQYTSLDVYWYMLESFPEELSLEINEIAIDGTVILWHDE